MLQYKIIEIFTSEEARWQGRPLSAAIVDYVRNLKIAARCLVTRAFDGCYESGELASQRIEVLSSNIPLRIVILLPAAEFDRVVPKIEEMVTDGIVAAQDLNVLSHKVKKLLLPKQIKVRDIMTPSPAKVTRSTALDEVVRLLLSSIFTGVPVVDAEGRPLGIITQGDLIYKGRMPMRLGLLAETPGDRLDAVLKALSSGKAEDVMTSPAISVEMDKPATEAVDLMLRKHVKRLPVIDSDGRVAGMLSRLDIFRTIMKEAPNWRAFGEQSIRVESLRVVADIMRRDTHTVLPDTPVEEVIRIIAANDIQRVAVIDRNGVFLGLISDRDLLSAFLPEHPEGIWAYLASLIPFTERGKEHREFREKLRERTAGEVMNTKLITVHEDTVIDEAIRIMTEMGLKRLPVLDPDGKFMGMISRDSLLRTGFIQAVKNDEPEPAARQSSRHHGRHEMKEGILLELPGKPPLRLTRLLLDFTGTLSLDGTLLPGVAERLTDLDKRMQIHVLAADTFGTAKVALQGLPVEMHLIRNGRDKAEFLAALKPECAAAIGNGHNDVEMLRNADLGIAVIGPEGCSADLVAAARIVAPNILTALDMLSTPLRMVATLRD